jgi:hypothetical protein
VAVSSSTDFFGVGSRDSFSSSLNELFDERGLLELLFKFFYKDKIERMIDLSEHSIQSFSCNEVTCFSSVEKACREIFAAFGNSFPEEVEVQVSSSSNHSIYNAQAIVPFTRNNLFNVVLEGSTIWTQCKERGLIFQLSFQVGNPEYKVSFDSKIHPNIELHFFAKASPNKKNYIIWVQFSKNFQTSALRG